MAFPCQQRPDKKFRHGFTGALAAARGREDKLSGNRNAKKKKVCLGRPYRDSREKESR